MRESEGMPEDDILVVELLVGVLLDPLWETHGRLTGCLRDVSASRVDLIIRVCGVSNKMLLGRVLTFGDMNSMSGEACSLPN